MRRLLLFCVLAVTACAGDPISGAATADPGHGKSPSAFVLHPADMKGYTEQSATTISAATLAKKEGDASITRALEQQGFQRGASNQFADPGTLTPTEPFSAVISQVLFFNDATGAESYFTAEMQRQRAVPAPEPGSKVALPSPPAGGVDHIEGILATSPGDASGAPAITGYFVLARRGRVVASISAYGNASVATQAACFALLEKQTHLLAASPD